jgi:peptide-methionine (S)-S-oxide reductase
MSNPTETATLGAGCFWCIQEIFQQLHGVEEAVSGYAGGHLENPSYEQVCGGNTGHVEVVQIKFNPAEISYKDILGVFWDVHDPTTLNRQGNDVGEQYRSVVFYHSDAQHAAAEEVLKEVKASGKWKNPIVTALEAYRGFFPAEEYHQEYFRKNPENAYCRLVVSPKVAKFRKHFEEKLRAEEK